MGIFDKIKGAIFGTHAEAAPAPKPTAPAPTPTPTATPASPAPSPSAPTATPTPAAPQPGTAPAAPAPTTTPAQAVDVAAMLDGAVKVKGQPLDWRKSIVDLMKALDLDSSIGARKELAAELHYTGDTSDSATMNVWLHKALMKKLAENGGKVPADLTD